MNFETWNAIAGWNIGIGALFIISIPLTLYIIFYFLRKLIV